MDKSNEEVDVNEQEIPFRLLPQEEQQRILDANQKKCVRPQFFRSGIFGFLHHLLGLLFF